MQAICYDSAITLTCLFQLINVVFKKKKKNKKKQNKKYLFFNKESMGYPINKICTHIKTPVTVNVPDSHAFIAQEKKKKVAAIWRNKGNGEISLDRN